MFTARYELELEIKCRLDSALNFRLLSETALGLVEGLKRK